MNWYEVTNAETLRSPSLLVYPDRVEQNLRRMILLAGDGQRLRPHVKTHKLPQIVKMKRQLGIDKLKAATLAEAEMTAAAGGQDVLLANQPVGPA
ncbi:MAG: alanine racemase, partial [Planctomycetota bacterium]